MAEVAQIAADEGERLCPYCGYDLRANPGERCSECGQPIDHNEQAHSAIPWVHRRHLGRVRTYLKTVWLVTIDSRKLRGQAGRILKKADAQSFRRITAGLMAVALVGAFAFVADDLSRLISDYRFNVSVVQPTAPRVHDLMVPWLAGITLPAVTPLMLVGFAFSLSGIHRRLFKAERPSREESAQALACYAAGPMAWCLPILSLGCALLYLDSIRLVSLGPGLVLIMIALATIGLLTIMGRITQLAIRVKRSGGERALIHAPYLGVLWLWASVVWLGVLPWAIGFVWIVIDSFRH